MKRNRDIIDRIEGQDLITCSYKLFPFQINKITNLAKKNKLSYSEMIRRMINFYVEE